MGTVNYNPLISVIVPIYNVEAYLRQCVDSILNQTYQNLEVILVDDGSSDNCGIICDEYAEQNSRVIVIHKKNGGLSDARNAGLEIFTGDYVAFVDSDDYISEDYIESLLYHEEFDVSICGATCFFDHSPEIKQVYATQEKQFLSEGIDYMTFEKMVFNAIFGYSCAKLYNRKVLYNRKFEDIPFREDIVFNIELLSSFQKVYISNSNGYFYRQRSSSLLHSKYNKEVPAIVNTCFRLIVTDDRFTSEENRKISNFLLKTYISDMVQICIVRNQKLSESQKKAELRSVFRCRELRKMIKAYSDDNKLFKIMAFCFKLNLPDIYYWLVKGQNE